MRFKAKGLHVRFLTATLGVVILQNLVHADEQSEEGRTRVIFEGISSNPGAIDISTGTGELAGALQISPPQSPAHLFISQSSPK